jgi:hypothetical protein
VADLQSTNDDLGDDDPLYSVALRYTATNTIGAQIGFTNSAANGLIGGNSGNFFAGLNFGFGGKGSDTIDEDEYRY